MQHLLLLTIFYCFANNSNNRNCTEQGICDLLWLDDIVVNFATTGVFFSGYWNNGCLSISGIPGNFLNILHHYPASTLLHHEIMIRQGRLCSSEQSIRTRRPPYHWRTQHRAIPPESANTGRNNRSSVPAWITYVHPLPTHCHCPLHRCRALCAVHPWFFFWFGVHAGICDKKSREEISWIPAERENRNAGESTGDETTSGCLNWKRKYMILRMTSTIPIKDGSPV